MTNTDMQLKIQVACDSIKTMLLEKNAAYGNSALDPLRVFSKADSVEQLRVRIDDKLSRIVRGSTCGEDTVKDLIGYLVLLLIAEEQPPVIPFRNLTLEQAQTYVCGECDKIFPRDKARDFYLTGRTVCPKCYYAAYPDMVPNPVYVGTKEAPQPETTAQKVEKALAKAEVPPAISTAFTNEEFGVVDRLIRTEMGAATPSELHKATGYPLRKVLAILKAIGKEASRD